MRQDLLHRVLGCSNCALHINQRPLVDTARIADVFWVGLSSVKVDKADLARPLASDTRTGSLLQEMEARLSNVSFYHTNLVKCLPESGGRIRYPRIGEMQSCFPHLLHEIELFCPQVVFLLGRQVSDYVFKQSKAPLCVLEKNFNYRAIWMHGVAYVPIHHPSFVLIYRRRSLNDYVDRICKVVRDSLKCVTSTDCQTQLPDAQFDSFS